MQPYMHIWKRFLERNGEMLLKLKTNNGNYFLAVPQVLENKCRVKLLQPYMHIWKRFLEKNKEMEGK